MTDCVEIGEWCRLYHADAADVLSTDEPVDSLVTDPPYGMAFKSNHRKVRYDGLVGDETDVALVWACNLPVRHAAYIFCRWDILGLVPPPKSMITWVKNNWSMGDLQHEHARMTEQILFYPGPEHAFPDGRPKDFLEYARTGNELHPTQKPIGLMREIVSWTTGTVVDPFMGSGTTALAAWMEGRPFVGIEIDRQWFDVAVERIRSQTEDGPLFAHRRAEQSALF